MFNKKIISNNLDKLAPQEIKVANYLMEQGFAIVNISINSIVKETKTSLATVNRTFTKLGFSGFKYYKMYLFARINNISDANDELNFQRDYLLLSLENTFQSLDQRLIDKVVNLLIANQSKIVILGEGFSYFIAKIFQSKLMKIFFDVKIFDENLYYGISNSNVLVIFSVNMSNKSLFKKIEVIRNINEKIKIVVFTTNPKIKNDPTYDYVICGSLIDNFEMNNQELPSDSLVVLTALANTVFAHIYRKNEANYQKLIEKIKW